MAGMEKLNAYYKSLQDKRQARRDFFPAWGRWLLGVAGFWWTVFSLFFMAALFGIFISLFGPLLAICFILCIWSVYLNIKRFFRVYIFRVETENGHTKDSLAELARNRAMLENNRLARQNRMPTFYSLD